VSACDFDGKDSRPRRRQAGDNIWVNADVLMTHDVCGPGTIGVFKREFGKDAKVWDKNRIVILVTHDSMTRIKEASERVFQRGEFPVQLRTENWSIVLPN
jgi:homoaconitase/3-isopropylmalate dehydratase large subunit